MEEIIKNITLVNSIDNSAKIPMEPNSDNVTSTSLIDCNKDVCENAPKIETKEAEKFSEHKSKHIITTTVKSQKEFYGKAQKYWQNIPATVNGMLGGLGYISAIDIQGSSTFLRELKVPGNKYALDCGAGIGRISKNLLMPRYSTVDLVEQDSIFAEKALEYCTMETTASIAYPKRLGHIYNMGLQEFKPDNEKYDLIWSQWVLGHLTDEDLLIFFQRIRGGLAPNAYFVIKENCSKQLDSDETDSSVTRPLKVYETYLRQAGFRIVRTIRQQSFPKGLYPVYMIACRKA